MLMRQIDKVKQFALNWIMAIAIVSYFQHEGLMQPVEEENSKKACKVQLLIAKSWGND